MCRHVWISSSVEYWVIYSHVDPTIENGRWLLKSASIPSGLCWSVGSSHIGMSKSVHWLGFIKIFFILLANHKTWPNIRIMTSPHSIVYEVVSVHTGIFTCSEDSARIGATVESSYVNDIVRMFLSKKYVYVWLSKYVEHVSHCIFSCFLEAFSINLLNPVLI